jgi:hypothetical protein
MEESPWIVEMIALKASPLKTCALLPSSLLPLKFASPNNLSLAKAIHEVITANST